MGGKKTIRKNFSQFRGLDYRSSDLDREQNFAIDFRNLILTKDGSIGTRVGGKIRCAETERLGLFNYAYSDETTGATSEELLSISDKLYKKQTYTYTISYAGVADDTYYSFYLDGTSLTYRFDLYENASLVLSVDCGVGILDVDGTLYTVANLAAAIGAIPNFSVTYDTTLVGAVAALLPVALVQDLSTDAVIDCYQWTAINYCDTSTTTPFATSYANKGADAYEHPSFCNFQDCAFIATGYEYLLKYDGQNLYRAGLPTPTAAPGVTAGAAGNVDTGTHEYIYFYKQVDNRGNITEGPESTGTSVTLAGASQVALTATTLATTSGFNTNFAQVNGAQVGVTTITVDAAHTLRVGDTAYFYDSISASYVEREVTAKTNTSITITGANVTVADNIFISNNLRIVFARTKAGGADYFIVAEVPYGSSISYNDNIADANLGGQYFIPIKQHDILAGKPKYIGTYQGLLIAGGILLEPNTIYFSTTESPESFPTATNSFDIPSTTTGGVTGFFASGDNFIIGKKNSLYTVSGGFDDFTFSIDKITEGALGIQSHNAHADIGDGSVIFLANRGFWMMQNGSQLKEVGAGINKIFFDPVLDESTRLITRRAFATFDPNTERYLCFIPTESGTGAGKYVNSNALVYAFDVFNNNWGEWDSLNMGGGIAVHDDVLWWYSKRDDSSTGVSGNLFRLNNSGTEYDFADHSAAISSVFGPQWEDDGEPSEEKIITRLRVYNLSQAVIQTPFTITVTTERNYITGTADSTLMYSFNDFNASDGWSYPPWGTDAWGAPITVLPKPKKLRNSKFNALRFVFSHATIHQQMVITGWDYEMVDCYRKEMI